MPARGARARAAQLRVAAGDPPAARSHAAAQGADQRARIIELLCAIPGSSSTLAQVLIAEFGLDMARCPTVRLFVSSAEAPSRPPRISWPPALRSNPAQAPLADRARQGSRPTKGTYFAAHFAPARPSAASPSDRRHPARNPGRLFPHRRRPGPTASSAPAGSASATPPNTARADSNANSKRSGTPSRGNAPKSTSRPPEPADTLQLRPHSPTNDRSANVARPLVDFTGANARPYPGALPG